jgi:hypothetical protein
LALNEKRAIIKLKNASTFESSSEKNILEKNKLAYDLDQVKGIYEILSTHHDKLLKKFQKYRNDMGVKSLDLAKLRFECNTYKRELMKNEKTKVTSKQEILLEDSDGKKISFESLAKKDKKFLKIEIQAKKEADFAIYVKDDLDSFRGRIDEYTKAGDLAEAEDGIARTLMADLRKKSMAGVFSAKQQFYAEELEGGLEMAGALVELMRKDGIGSLIGKSGKNKLQVPSLTEMVGRETPEKPKGQRGGGRD